MTKPNLKEIEWAISDLEEQDTSENRYILLAALYTCRNHMLGLSATNPQPSAYSEAEISVPKALGLYGKSDFLHAIAGKDPVDIFSVMDELMETLHVVNPRAYNSVLRKISRI